MAVFDVDLVATCGQLLSLAIAEGIPGEPILVVGERARQLRFPGRKHSGLEDPRRLRAISEYGAIVCIQCPRMLSTLKIMNMNNRLYASSGDELIPLSKAQQEQARQFFSSTGMKLKSGSAIEAPLEMHNFMMAVERALAPKGTAHFFGFGESRDLASLSTFKPSVSSFARFLASTDVGKMHVVNSNPYLAKGPHPAKDSDILALLESFGPRNTIIPWLDIEQKADSHEKQLLQPYVTRFHDVFSDWSSYVKEILHTASRLQGQLQDKKEITELYSTLFVLEEEAEAEFVENAWQRAEEILQTPPNIDAFALKLTKAL